MEKFVNKRYVKNITGKYRLYTNNNGVFKECSPIIARKKGTNLFYRLSDLPTDMQTSFEDIAISEDEYQSKVKFLDGNEYILGRDNTKIRVNDDTPLMPIVGNLLPCDGVDAYSVVIKNSKLILSPILICFNCHWSDLFSGNTKYENNVFCLLSDLPVEQIEKHISEVIYLKDVPNYLGDNYQIKVKK